jgi:O-antigen/teichoic acid export membrane protein
VIAKRHCFCSRGKCSRAGERGHYLRHSIIRRSMAVMIAFGLGHAINYGLLWEANHLLDKGGFGLFYTAVLIINILFSPMMGVMLVLARQLAEAGARHGRPQILAMTWRLLAACARMLPIVLLCSAILALAVSLIGLEAWPVALLIPITVMALVATEILRTSFQGMLLFGWQNAVWLVSNAAQFAFAIGALWLIRGVWPGVAGIFLGALITFTAFLPWFVRATARVQMPSTAVTFALPLLKEWPTVIAYSLFILMNNIDILIGYLLLPHSELDIYAASSLLPKAITTVTFVIAQVMLPVVVDQKSSDQPYRRSIVKSVAMTVGLGIAAIAVLWIAIPWLQTTALAIRGLDYEMMLTVAVSAVALGAIRTLIVLEIALQRYSIGLAQCGAILVFALACVLAHPSALTIADIYTATTCGFLIVIGILSLALRPSSFQIPRIPLGRPTS